MLGSRIFFIGEVMRQLYLFFLMLIGSSAAFASQKPLLFQAIDNSADNIQLQMPSKVDESATQVVVSD